jgi:elongin-A
MWCNKSKLSFASVEIVPYVIAISSLGNDLRFELIKPVLTGCSPETLSRLENTSPVRVQNIFENLSKFYPI